MSDPTKRAARWKAKYNVERVKDTRNDLREDMAKRYERAPIRVFAPWLLADVGQPVRQSSISNLESRMR